MSDIATVICGGCNNSFILDLCRHTDPIWVGRMILFNGKIEKTARTLFYSQLRYERAKNRANNTSSPERSSSLKKDVPLTELKNT